MKPRSTRARRLRELIERPGAIRSLGAHDVLTAMALAEAGFEAGFLGGFGVSASLLGLPDLDFLGVEEIERAGAAGLIPEDQVSPKRCGRWVKRCTTKRFAGSRPRHGDN